MPMETIRGPRGQWKHLTGKGAFMILVNGAILDGSVQNFDAASEEDLREKIMADIDQLTTTFPALEFKLAAIRASKRRPDVDRSVSSWIRERGLTVLDSERLAA